VYSPQNDRFMTSCSRFVDTASRNADFLLSAKFIRFRCAVCLRADYGNRADNVQSPKILLGKQQSLKNYEHA
jgi:hypothetical protein